MKPKHLAGFLLALFFASCGVMLFHDYQNPCTSEPGGQECTKWKRDYPKEYKRYKMRMRDDSIKKARY